MMKGKTTIEEKGQTPNRKPTPKSITQIMKNLDGCTEEELEYLRNNFQYDQSYGYLESLQNDLLNKPDKPIFFDRPSFTINPVLLVKQFHAIEKTGKDLVLHDFLKDSPVYRKLYKWSGFQLAQDLFTFVHYQIYTKKFLPTESLVEGLDLEQVPNLQKLLITSHSRGVPQKTKDIMSAMENLLDSNMTQIILHFSLVIFVFEHNGLDDGAGEYRIAVAFQYHSHSQHLPHFIKSKTDPGKPLILSGDDLFDNFLGVEEEGSAMVEEGLDLAKLRRLLRDAELSYSYYGFSRK